MLTGCWCGRGCAECGGDGAPGDGYAGFGDGGGGGGGVNMESGGVSGLGEGTVCGGKMIGFERVLIRGNLYDAWFMSLLRLSRGIIRSSAINGARDHCFLDTVQNKTQVNTKWQLQLLLLSLFPLCGEPTVWRDGCCTRQASASARERMSVVFRYGRMWRKMSGVIAWRSIVGRSGAGCRSVRRCIGVGCVELTRSSSASG